MTRTKTSILAILLIPGMAIAADRVSTGNRTTVNIPELDPAVMVQANQYASVRSANLLDWHPDGNALLVTTRFADTSQIHLVSNPLGMRKQLTYFAEPVTNGAYSQKTKHILFGKDSGGDENYQGFLLDPTTGIARQVTPAGSRNSGLRWNHEGTQFAYMSNQADKSRFDIWLASAEAPEQATMIVEGTGFYWVPVAFSADNKYLLVKQVVSAVDSRPYVVELATGSLTRVGPTDLTASYGGFSSGVITADGKGVYIPSDLDAEFAHLRYFEPGTSISKNLTPDIPWNVTSLRLAPNARTLAFVTNEDGISRLYFLNTRTQKYREANNIPTGLISGISFSPDSRSLALTLNRADSPSDVYVYNLKRARLNAWTRSETGGLDRTAFVVPKLIHYPTFDTVDETPRKIPAFVYKPKAATGKLPVIIYIHGGPEGQSRPRFSGRTQLLVNRLNAAVILPNVRGSSGYGKTYLGLDNGVNREESVRDIGALIKWIGTQDNLDPSRIAVLGGSYGGYMVLASLTHYSSELKAGINSFGISNFVTFLENTSDYRRDHRRQEYGDERDPVIREYLTRTAPMNHVGKITVPLFVLQGANDPRVPASESEQIVTRVAENGTDVWYLLFDDEGHGFRKKPNQVYSNAAMVEFLKAHL